MHTNLKSKNSGFTLVETIITTVILTIAAAGLVSFLISIQYKSQDSLYNSTALTVAISTLEQMKSTSSSDLEINMASSNFSLITSADIETPLNLGAENLLQIPIVTNTDVDQELPLILIPSIQTLANNSGFVLEVGYAYDHPRKGRTRTQMVRCTKSRIANY